ncbi:gluconolactonase [Acuticoccus sediminis]|uniref:Gluconolactonase n=1 Tax=Acuticoccus sediminis TaxID=2184697 RepID=A0A8B2NPI1_9HYPH|nr:isochorismatase family protein [Acuticoccus sediminis]RAH98848.1 gluconolactonase [Acuticoccus sediminis]
MAHDALTPAFRALVDEHAPVAQVGSGFQFTEGPVWHPDGYLLFSDIPADVRRRADASGVREVKRGTNKGNGQTFDTDLNLVVCEHATSSLVRLTPGGTREVLASHFEGRELNSPNDVVVSSKGWIYFTDPWYGRMPVFGVERPRELGFQGVYRVKPGMAEPELVVDRYQFSMPNGLCFSPDESRLYVNDTEQTNIRVFDVDGQGRPRNGRVFASGIKDSLKAGVPDGMKCDFEGNVWVTAPGGIWVYAPDGRHIGRVAIPELAANFHWGGTDWRTLYVTASTSLYSLPVKVGPRSEPYMRARPSRTSAAPVEGGLELSRCALIIQDMQNDVVMEGGAFASSGAPAHCREQRAIENAARLAERCRALGVPVIFVWFVVDPGAPGMTLNAPLFEGTIEANALVRGTWGAAPVPGLEPQGGDYVVEKCRMSAWEGTRLETVLKAEGRDTLISCGAWTNMSVEHTARTGADKGYLMIVPEDACSTMNADWHRASIDYALQNVSAVTTTDAVLDALG